MSTVHRKLTRKEKESKVASFYETRIETLKGEIEKAITARDELKVFKLTSTLQIISKMYVYLTDANAFKKLHKQFGNVVRDYASSSDEVICTMELWRTIRNKYPEFAVFEEKSVSTTKQRVGQFLVVKALNKLGYNYAGNLQSGNNFWIRNAKKAS